MLVSWFPTLATLQAHSKEGLNGISETDKKVGLIWSVLQSLMPLMCVKTKKNRSFSPLRFLCWASLFYGARAQGNSLFPSTFSLSALDGTNGFSMIGSGGDRIGWEVLMGGDVNGDEYADLIIGAPTRSRVYLFFGNSIMNIENSYDLKNVQTIPGLAINITSSTPSFGESISIGRDVNGDGVGDILIGDAQQQRGNPVAPGMIYVLFGSRNLNKNSTFDLEQLNSSTGCIIKGENIGDEFGNFLTAGKDVNGDGLDDFVVGAPYFTYQGRPRAGRTYVFFGNKNLCSSAIMNASNLDGSNGFIMNKVTAGSTNGHAISIMGDVNDDNISDIVIGERTVLNPNDGSQFGVTYVVFGSASIGNNGTLDPTTVSGTDGFSIYGKQYTDGRSGQLVSDFFGESVSTACDLNGDGIEDIVASSSRSSFSTGSIRVFFGGKQIGAGGNISITDINGVNGYSIIGSMSNYPKGEKLSCGGDINHDGYDDLLFGLPVTEPGGRSYLFYGRTSPVIGGMINISTPSLEDGFIIKDNLSQKGWLYSLSLGGDFDGDGVDDLIAINRDAWPMGRRFSGIAFVVYGRGSGIIIPPTAPPTYKSTAKSTVKAAVTLTNLESLSTKSVQQLIPAKSTFSRIVSASSDPHLMNSSLSESLVKSSELSNVISSTSSSTLDVVTHFSNMTNSHQNVDTTFPTDQIPLYIGLASGTAALAYSLLVGCVYFVKKSNHEEQPAQGTQLVDQDPISEYVAIDAIIPEMESARVENTPTSDQVSGNYAVINVNHPPGHYNQLSNTPAPYTQDHYTSIDKVEKQHDGYMAAKFNKAHENYDDINLDGGI